MALPKYQVHDETSQVSDDCLVILFFHMDMELLFMANQMRRCYLPCLSDSVVCALLHFVKVPLYVIYILVHSLELIGKNIRDII